MIPVVSAIDDDTPVDVDSPAAVGKAVKLLFLISCIT